ncbi:hypothetical protein FRC00_005819 [Tulasnella sp. 408]|nr:hypothetical protein FRC00_005819 [Tulasnella sp. 408]
MSDTSNRTRQMSSTNDPVTRERSSQLLSLPVELHEHMSIFLLTSSILNLIETNHHLRSIYEAILYRCINIQPLSSRSIGLLETFKLRPDLALLVHTLDIDLRPTVVSAFHPTQSAFQDINALALAKNIKSLGIFGLSWLPGTRLNAFQKAISGMKLKGLRIKEPEPASRNHHRNSKEEVVASLRQVLQAQPHLQDLELDFWLFRISMGVNEGRDIQFGIRKSDVPRLRTLGTHASTIVPLLEVIDDGQLDSLTIYYWKQEYHDSLVSSFSNSAKTRKVRRLHLSTFWTANRGWGFDLGQALELFPNIESLRITGLLSLSLDGRADILDEYINQVEILAFG